MIQIVCRVHLDFFLIALPVLCGKGEDCQEVHVEIGTPQDKFLRKHQQDGETCRHTGEMGVQRIGLTNVSSSSGGKTPPQKPQIIQRKAAYQSTHLIIKSQRLR